MVSKELQNYFCRDRNLDVRREPKPVPGPPVPQASGIGAAGIRSWVEGHPVNQGACKTVTPVGREKIVGLFDHDINIISRKYVPIVPEIRSQGSDNGLRGGRRRDLALSAT